jgi:CubicO group peptidase (beta-lactamase class C family)
MKRWVTGVAFVGTFVLADPAAWSQANLGLTQAPAEQVGMSKQKLDRIRDTLKQEVDQGKLAGTVVLVARKGKLVYADAVGFQDKEEGKPMALDSIFRIYSMTKPLVSIGAMMLVEDGRIELTDPVSKFLPAFKAQQVSVARTDAEFARVTYASVPADREATVQDLLRHTSGLVYCETLNTPVKDAYAKAGFCPKSGVLSGSNERKVAPDEQIDHLAKAPLAHQPGTVWEYGLSVDLLGRVIEAVSGKRLADFLDERLFKPLKMNDTSFWVTMSKVGRVAQPPAVDAASGRPIELFDVSKEPGNDSGGAGAVSTAIDYLRFAQMLLNGGQLDGVQVLSRTTVALMTADHLGTRIAPGQLLVNNPGYTFGLGFAVRQAVGVAPVVGSAGEFTWGGYAGTYFWVDPKEGLVGVYMSQAPGPLRPYYNRLVKQLVYQAIAD